MRCISRVLLLVVLVLSPAWCCRAQMVVIAHASFPVDQMSKDDLRGVFTGAVSTIGSGLHVKPVLLKRGPIHDEFLAAFIGENAAQFRSDWMTGLFSGKLLLPPTLDSEDLMIDYVAHHEFSVGYIHRSTPHKGVIVLTIR